MISFKYKKTFLAVTLFITLFANSQQKNYWQQELHYKIAATLLPETHQLNCNIQIDYINHSPDTLIYIWFHIWPNAYKDKSTALFKQLSSMGKLTKKVDSLSENGFINQFEWKVNGKKVSFEIHSQYNDIIKIILQKPLMPGGKIKITTPFNVKIPNFFSRMGFTQNEFIISQWYPKPAVYDSKGWHIFPYLHIGEFYSEFGSYKVTITVPSQYVVAATGTLENKKERNAYKRIGKTNYAIINSVELKDTSRERKKIMHLINYLPANKSSKTKTLTFFADNVHDFAWFADPDFIINYNEIKLPSGKTIDAFSYYHIEKLETWALSLEYVKETILNYSSWIGEYAYPVVSIVECPLDNNTGGMEYPMISLINSPAAKNNMLDVIIAHEIGHNWFYAMLGTNERSHAWMDEGMNTFFQFRYESNKYRSNIMLQKKSNAQKNQTGAEFEKELYNSLHFKLIDSIDKEAASYKSDVLYAMSVNLNAARWMNLLKTTIGKTNLDKAMQQYFNQWKFKHPYPDDFKKIVESVSGIELNHLFELLKTSKVELKL